MITEMFICYQCEVIDAKMIAAIDSWLDVLRFRQWLCQHVNLIGILLLDLTDKSKLIKWSLHQGGPLS